MKSLYNLLILAASVIMTVGCTRDFDENNNANSRLKISISNEESQTRAKMIDNPGLKMTVQWSETDKLDCLEVLVAITLNILLLKVVLLVMGRMQRLPPQAAYQQVI